MQLAKRHPSLAYPVALVPCSRACRAPGGSRQQGVAVALLSDVAALLQLGRPAVVTSLMDLSRLLEAAKQQLEGEPVAGKVRAAEWHMSWRVYPESSLLSLPLVLSSFPTDCICCPICLS